MMLEPTSEGTQPFQREWIQYFIPAKLERTPNMLAFTGVDFCWIEAAQRNNTGSDHSVVMTWIVDDKLNRYLVDVFREQCTRRKTIEEAARQSQIYKSVVVGMSISDRKHVEDDIKDYENRTSTRIPVEWISDLKGGEGVSAATTKARKHIGVLQPLFMQKSVYIPMGLKWFEEEILYCPRSRTDDGMDAFVCAVVPSFPAMPQKITKTQTAEDVQREYWRKDKADLLKGRQAKKSSQNLGRLTRRARARAVVGK
jgi:hypothetical protein